VAHYWPYLTLALLLVVVAAGLCAGVIWMLAKHLLHPKRMTDGNALYLLRRLSPSDLGLRYEKVDFHIRDEATGQRMHIAGWWMPAAIWSDQTVVILHGYSDAKIGGIAWAPTFHDIGRNVLAIDLRAHGESGGRHCTGGYFERIDVERVLDELQASRPQSTRRIALFGVSLGAAVAAAVAAKRDDLCAVILECPFPDYASAIAQHGKRMAMPLEWAYRPAMRLAERLSGAKFDEVRPVDMIPRIQAPLLVISSGADSFVPQWQIDRLAAAVAARPSKWPSHHLVVPGVEHVLALASDPQGYRDLMRSFLGDC
jgi:pimeloyl-ACP methyl ester carboxylesterase